MRARALTVTTALLALVLSSAPSAGAADYSYEFRYRGGVAGGQVTDGSDNLNHGTISTINGGSVASTTDSGSSDAYLRFPSGSCTATDRSCPQGMIQPKNSNVNPGAAGSATFVFGANVRLPDPVPTAGGMNVVQRGFFGAPQWKLQVDGGYATCRFSDGTNDVLVPAAGDQAGKYMVPSGQWVKLRCGRLPGNVFELKATNPATGAVLKQTRVTATAVGALTATGPVTIGAKAVSGKSDAVSDQFHGDMDEVFFHTD